MKLIGCNNKFNTKYIACITGRLYIEEVLNNVDNIETLKNIILISIINPNNRYLNVLKDIQIIENFINSKIKKEININVYIGNGKFFNKNFKKENKEEMLELNNYLKKLKNIIKRVKSNNGAIEDKNSVPLEKELLNLTYDNITVSFWDIEYDIARYKTIDNKTAKQIMKFILKHKNNVKNGNKKFLIHCSAGISRSSGVGLAIHCLYDYDGNKKEFLLNKEKCKILNSNLFDPNITVFDKIIEEFNKEFNK